MIFRLIAMAVLVSLGGLSGCTVDKECTSGATQVCVCAGAAQGAQTCRDDQTGWTTCVCDDPGSDAADLTPGEDEEEDTEHGDSGAGDGSVGDDQSEDSGEPDFISGSDLYVMHCQVCHGSDAQGTSAGPNIVWEVLTEPADEIVEIIVEGEDNMPAIEVTEVQALRIVVWLKAFVAVDSGASPHDDDDKT